MASNPQKNLQFISPSKEAGDFLQNQVKQGESMEKSKKGSGISPNHNDAPPCCHFDRGEEEWRNLTPKWCMPQEIGRFPGSSSPSS
jgi:hypothetical protein